jgi:hypothetical protein
MIAATNHFAGRAAGDEARMFHPLIRTLVKVAVASLIVGTILTHFGITPEKLIKEFGLSSTSGSRNGRGVGSPGPGPIFWSGRW